MFEQLNKKMQQQFVEMQKLGKLFRSELTGQEIWDIYIKGFNPEQNPIFRDPSSSYHNCNNDNNFIRRYGNIVAINENLEIISMFDIDVAGTPYENTIPLVASAIKKAKVKDVFFETFNELNVLPYEKTSKTASRFQLGMSKTFKRYNTEEVKKFGVVNENDIYTFHHFHVFLDKSFVKMSNKSVESHMGEYRDAKNVFQRAMETISEATLMLVIDLINQGSLLNGTTHLHKVQEFLPLKRQYDSLAANKKDNWCWVNSYELLFAKFRNELIGTLCTELSEGVELNKACKDWNYRIDPVNYHKATAPITQRQIEEAKKVIELLGYSNSFNRRFAILDDINISEILHSNVGDTTIKSAGLFDSVKPSVSHQHKKNQFDGIEEVGIEKFMKDILPNCTGIEAFFENRMENNLVTITTAVDKASKLLFKWDNPFSWTYKDNLAGKSMIKEAVKERGGKVEGCLNIRLHFPNTTSDYDLHVIEPTGNHIFYSKRRTPQQSTGVLDLDAQGIDGNFPPEKRVENVIYTDKSKMPNGEYTVYVNNYIKRDNLGGFDMEIEFEDQIYSLKSSKILEGGANIICCKITKTLEGFTIKPLIDVINSSSITKSVWGLDTNQFHKVNLVSLSPNHWGINNIGNKHYFFILDKCYSNEPMRSFHIENINSELLEARKVLEVLGETNKLEPNNKQLAGLGFNSTVKDELIVKLSGTFKRTIKIKF